MMFAYSRWINRFADHIICANDGIARRYADDGIPAERLTVLPVWIPGVQHLVPALASSNGGSFDVIYAGNLGPCQQLETLVRGAALLKDTAPGIRVHLYGSGSSEVELRALSNDLGATNVQFHGRVSLAEAFRRSSEAAVQVVSLRRSPEFRSTVPSKLSLMFAAGAPFVYGLEGDAAAVAEQSQGGVPFDQGDPASVAAAIQTLSRMSDDERRTMRSRLREYYETRFSPFVILEEYARILLGAKPGTVTPASAD
jgi:glycosyltransferase involved in cell wall biosynthesis